ncbi:MAG: hypothetical protein AB1813_07870 [Verrucomicrobiota bacterium]
MNRRFTSLLVLLGAAFSAAISISAFDYEGHRVVNQLALSSLPADFPAFVRDAAARERIAFLSGEPDRWRNTPELALRHCNGPDHFFDLEDLEWYDLTPAQLTHFRYDFLAHMAVVRHRFPQRFPAIDPLKDSDHTKALPGFLPWTIAESFARLKSAFSYLKEFEQGGTTEEIANAQANVIYLMGVMGHFAGDAAQPLHTTRHYNGWVGENPRGYTTTNRFHSWIDGGYLQKVGGVRAADLGSRMRPARVLGTNVFGDAMQFILKQHQLVDPLYELEKRGGLTGEGEKGREGIAFLSDRIVEAGQFLADLWLTAKVQAPPDNYLRSALARRKLNEAAPKVAPVPKP